MLDTSDYLKSKQTLRIIHHVKDGDTPNRLSFVKILEILDFILTNINLIMFTRDGKPKSKIQLVGSFFQIIFFLRDLCRMINGNVAYKGKAYENKTAEQIRRSRDDSQKPNA